MGSIKEKITDLAIFGASAYSAFKLLSKIFFCTFSIEFRHILYLKEIHIIKQKEVRNDLSKMWTKKLKVL